MPRIGERQNKAADFGGKQSGENVLERHIAIVRRFGIPPAYMQAHAVTRHIDERAVDRGYDLLDEIDKH